MAHKLDDMKTFLFFLILSNLSPAFAATLSLPADIAVVVSADGKYDAKYSNAVRERFIVRNALGGEGSQVVILEKFAPGKYGTEDKIIAARSYPVSELPGVKEYLAEVAQKSVEATYGCCDVESIKRIGTEWTFKAKHGSVSFNCKSKDTPQNDRTVSCTK